MNQIMKEKVAQYITKLKELTNVSSIEITATPAEDISIFDSKFGGLPYIAQDSDVPMCSEGKPLQFLAQYRMDDIADTEDQSILQFWIYDDDLYGLDLENPTKCDKHRVIFIDQPDKRVTKEAVSKKYQGDKIEFRPIVGEYKLSFNHAMVPMNHTDIYYKQYEPQLIEIFKDVDDTIESIEDLDDDVLDAIWEQISNGGHRIAGYPFFTQEDPRIDERYKDYKMLLLQIDTDFNYSRSHSINWGDSGIANFFIDPKDLEQLDFSKVLYNWDCY